MLPKNNRLLNNDDFKKVEAEGTVFQSHNFGVAILDRKDNNPTRFGFVVSTKVSHEATTRNYAKRKMREGVRRCVTLAKNGMDVVFLAKQNITRTATDEVMREVQQALKNCNILN